MFLLREVPMYVCVCKAVSDRIIRRAAEQGPVTLRELCSRHGLGSVCGRCVPEARRVLAEHRAASVERAAPLPEAAAA